MAFLLIYPAFFCNEYESSLNNDVRHNNNVSSTNSFCGRYIIISFCSLLTKRYCLKYIWNIYCLLSKHLLVSFLSISQVTPSHANISLHTNRNYLIWAAALLRNVTKARLVSSSCVRTSAAPCPLRSLFFHKADLKGLYHNGKHSIWCLPAELPH